MTDYNWEAYYKGQYLHEDRSRQEGEDTARGWREPQGGSYEEGGGYYYEDGKNGGAHCKTSEGFSPQSNEDVNMEYYIGDYHNKNFASFVPGFHNPGGCHNNVAQQFYYASPNFRVSQQPCFIAPQYHNGHHSSGTNLMVGQWRHQTSFPTTIFPRTRPSPSIIPASQTLPQQPYVVDELTDIVNQVLSSVDPNVPPARRPNSSSPNGATPTQHRLIKPKPPGLSSTGFSGNLCHNCGSIVADVLSDCQLCGESMQIGESKNLMGKSKSISGGRSAKPRNVGIVEPRVVVKIPIRKTKDLKKKPPAKRARLKSECSESGEREGISPLRLVRRSKRKSLEDEPKDPAPVVPKETRISFQPNEYMKFLICSIDGCVFNTNKPERMSRHVASHCTVTKDTSSNGRTFQCPDCGAKFFSLAKMLKHDRKTHTGVKDYECRLCEAEVTDIAGHTKIHREEKDIKCKFCDLVFRHRHSYVRHLSQHSPPDNYTPNGGSLRCEECNTSFITPKDLLSHVNSSHPKPGPEDLPKPKLPETPLLPTTEETRVPVESPTVKSSADSSNVVNSWSVEPSLPKTDEPTREIPSETFEESVELNPMSISESKSSKEDIPNFCESSPPAEETQNIPREPMSTSLKDYSSPVPSTSSADSGVYSSFESPLYSSAIETFENSDINDILHKSLFEEPGGKVEEMSFVFNEELLDDSFPPPTETRSLEESKSLEESMSPIEPKSPIEPRSLEESMSPVEPMSLQEPMSPIQSKNLKESMSPIECKSLEESMSSTESKSLKESISPHEPIGLEETINFKESLSLKEHVSPEESNTLKEPTNITSMNSEESNNYEGPMTPEVSIPYEESADLKETFNSEESINPEVSMIPVENMRSEVPMSPEESMNLEVSMNPEVAISPEVSMNPEEPMNDEEYISPQESMSAAVNFIESIKPDERMSLEETEIPELARISEETPQAEIKILKEIEESFREKIQRFAEELRSIREERVVKNEAFSCEKCGRKYKFENFLKAHKRRCA